MSLTTLTVALWLLLAGVQGGTFFMTAPRTMYRGTNYDVTVDMLMGEVNAVEMKLVSKERDPTTGMYHMMQLGKADGLFASNETKIISIPIPKDAECLDCQLLVEGKGPLEFETRMDVFMGTIVTAILIQTDKAIYRPGQSIRFRVFAIQSSLKIYEGLFDIYVADPDGNKLMEWTGQKGTEGVVMETLDLCKDTVLGMWKLHVTLKDTGDRKIQEFEVIDYELPKFVIDIDMPEYGLISAATLTGFVKARYTYGEPVSGQVELHVGPNVGPDECGRPARTTQLSFQVEGEEMFELPISDIQRSTIMYDRASVKLVAYVTEASTGVIINTTKIITFYEQDYDLRFLDSTPVVFKPGLPFTMFVQIGAPNWMPIVGNTDNVLVYSEVYYKYTVADQGLYCSDEYSGTYPLQGQNLTLPTNGILPVEIDIPGNATSVCVKVTFRERSISKTIKQTHSRSSSFLQLRLLGSNIKAGSVANFSITGTEPLYDVTYVVAARGTIVTSGMVNGTGNTTFTFTLNVTSEMAPTGRVLIYYVRDDSEVVVDSIAFQVEGMFLNKVSLGFSTDTSAPGDDLNMTLSADPDSLVNLLAVDESILMLGTGNDITFDRVDAALKEYDFGQRPDEAENAISYSAESSLEVFQKTGLVVLTDVGMSSEYHYNHDCGPEINPKTPTPATPEVLSGGEKKTKKNETSHEVYSQYTSANSQGSLDQALADRESDLDNDFFIQVDHINKLLPDSWLWESHKVGADGKATIKATAPETLTSWVASAFATNLKTGLGIAATHGRLKVLRSFFVVLSMPKTVIQREHFAIQATIFNYLKEELSVNVTLKGNDNIENIKVASNGKQTYESKDRSTQIKIAPEKQGLVHFGVKSSEIGLFTIEVTAASTLAVYTAKEQINVRPEGVPLSYNYPFVIKNMKEFKGEMDVSLTVPDSAVHGSVKYKVKVTGDLFGISLKNLESLVLIPTGCGEQSVARFGPSVYIGQYLKVTGQLTPEMDKKIKNIITKGYQRQLTFRRHDGSFSAFGKLDAQASTWLTALVALTLGEARQFIYVDPVVISQAMTWLIEKQQQDGSYREFGNVLDKAVERANMGPSLTAFVILALKKNSDLNQQQECQATPPDCTTYYRWNNATAKAERYLESHNGYASMDQFSLAIISYAMQQIKSPFAEKLHKRLEQWVVEKGRYKFWKDGGYTGGYSMVYPVGTWKPPGEMQRPIDVITTSYALLGLINSDNDGDNAFMVANWIIQQRNSRGGFVSSQDTLVALKALTAYAWKYKRPDTDLEVVFVSDKGEGFPFNITTDNALDLQTNEFKDTPIAAAKIKAHGTGMALAEFDVSFYVTKPVAMPSFDVSVVFLEDEGDRFTIMVCTKSLHHDATTGMVVQEISVPSGFKPHFDTLRDVAGLKRVEKEENLVSIYFDQITRSSTCYNLPMTRVGKVAKVQKNYIKTIDYYEPEYQSIVLYQPMRAAASTICHVCSDCCSGSIVFWP